MSTLELIGGGVVEEPRCPRCGYDLAGTVAAWRESCPTTGVCSGCEYGLDWQDVLVASRRRVPWLFEHARGSRESWRAA